MDVKEKNKVINIIKKLHQLSKSSNLNESVAALEKAKEIQSKYNISNREIELCAIDCSRKTITWWLKSLASIISEYYECILILSTNRGKTKMIFFGSEVNVQLLGYTYTFLARKINRMIRDFKKSEEKMSIKKVNSYVSGILISLKERLPSSFDEKGWENLIKKANEFLGLGKEIRISKNMAENREALSAGYQDGENISVRRGMNENSNKEIPIINN